MRINGQWAGWGLGDNSTADFTVRNFKAFARRMYRSYMGDLADTNAFDEQMYDKLCQCQDRLVASGALVAGRFIRGVLDLETEYATTFKKRPPSNRRPFVITVEGHMSNMFIGPAAAIGEQMEAEGLAWHQPVGYDNTALPFDNQSGVNALLDVLNSDWLGPNNDRPFDEDLDHYLLGFSQGSIVTGKTFLHHLRPADPNSRLGKRYRHLKRAIAFGDPYREKNVNAQWVPDGPSRDTQGISDERLDNTPPWWKPHSRHGDLYSENPDNEVGLDRTSIYKIAAENSWIGGPAAIFSRIIDELEDPVPGTIDIIKAIIGGVLFLGDMTPHGGYDLGPPTDYIRRGLRGEPQPTA